MSSHAGLPLVSTTVLDPVTVVVWRTVVAVPSTLVVGPVTVVVVVGPGVQPFADFLSSAESLKVLGRRA
ncbi:MAG TPA: hypothetical protein VJ044_08920 [Candidatus Hodarchaeales archaeon]|nr:hypothetical protein [Candidatus Hodarchaeales archaeon]